MQPLVSPVDHESRHQEYQDEVLDEAQEYTPLLRNSSSRPHNHSSITTLFVVIMMSILILGTVVSVFLLLEQDKEWPVNLPFEMLSRKQWKAKASQWPPVPTSHKPVTYAILTHTGFSECFDEKSCVKSVQELQNLYQGSQFNKTDLPFNFMISGDGLTYEGRGWDVTGEIDPSLDSNAVSIAALGNFSTKNPSSLQLQEIKAFLDESIWRRKLVPNYKLVGRSFNGNPENLFSAVSKWNHWNSTSDSNI